MSAVTKCLKRDFQMAACLTANRAAAVTGDPSESIDSPWKDNARYSIAAMKQFRHLNAFTFAASEDNINEQLNSLSKVDGGLLKGMTIAIKDNFCVDGMPTTCGSKMLNSFAPTYNATVVKKLINAGAVIVGKTNMDEFGMGNGTVDTIYGPTKNIWGLEKFQVDSQTYKDWHVPGGSSGGSAVAVAAGLCQGAIGSDTGGSTRNPASYCGVVGLKPTYGIVSRHGLIPLVNSMDVPGILTRTVKDCATLFDIIKGWDPEDSTTVKTDMSPTVPIGDESLDGIHVGIPKEFACEGLASDIDECWKNTVEILKQKGARISEVSLPHTKYSIVCYSVLNTCEVASNMARYDGLKYGHRALNPKQNSTEALYAQTRQEGFNVVVRGRILAGNYFLLKSNYDKYFQQALKVRRLIQNDFENVWKKGVDILLTPCTLTSAPTYSDFIRWDNRKQSSIQDYCTQSANLAGVPALSIPIKLSQDGLPLSLQLIAPRFGEKLIFHVGNFIEREVNFPLYNAQNSDSSNDIL